MMIVWAFFELGLTHVVEDARRNKGLTLQATVPHDVMENLMLMRTIVLILSGESRVANAIYIDMYVTLKD